MLYYGWECKGVIGNKNEGVWDKGQSIVGMERGSDGACKIQNGTKCTIYLS